MNKKKINSSRDLFDDVIDAGLCIYCGACSGSCPYLVSRKGKIRLLDNCTLSKGQCYQYCPRTYTDMDTISRSIFGVPYSKDELGTVGEIMVARSKDNEIRSRAQYGGIVTTLLTVAFLEGFLEGAIMTKMSDDKYPNPAMPRNREQILECAGSSYMACPVLEEMNKISGDSRERLGIVAMPCQALSLAKMKNDPPKDRVNIDNIKIVIGLFCTWALSPDTFHPFLKRMTDLRNIVKFDIPPPPADRFDVYTSNDKSSFPLDKIRPFTMPACAFCHDMTSEFADISVGSVEGSEGWNTVIVRTEAGADLLERARAKGWIETNATISSNIDHLKDAALIKKKRALKNIIERSGDKSDSLFLGLRGDLIEKLLDQS